MKSPRNAVAVIAVGLVFATLAGTIPPTGAASSQPTTEPATNPSANEWVKRLGDDRWKVREEAQRQLIEMGEQARAAVMPALTSPDPEVRARARAVWAGINVGAAARFTCSGRVADANGAPVAGAEVVAYMWWNDPAKGRALDLIGKCAADANGRFAFNNPLKDGYPHGFVAARAPGMAAAWTSWQCKDDCTLALTLQKPRALSGTVVDDKGSPIAGATVLARLTLPSEHGGQTLDSLPPFDWFAAKTDDRGRFRYDNVPPETRAAFLAWAPGKGRADLRDANWELIGDHPAAAGRTDLRITLPPESAIEGTVVDKRTRKPLGGLAVNVGCVQAPAVSGADGAFRIGSLSAGKFTVSLATSPLAETGEWVAAPVEVRLQPGQTAKGVAVEAVKGGLVKAVITDVQDGRPIEGASFLVFPDSGDFGELSLAGWRPVYSGRSNKEGLAVVRLPPGEHRLISAEKSGEYYAKDLEHKVFTVVEGGGEQIEIRLHRLNRVAGTVVDEAGKPVAGARVMGVRTTGAGLTNAAGAFDFNWQPCNSGPMDLRLLVQHEQRNLCALADVPEAADEEIKVRVSPGVRVIGIVTDPEGKPLHHAMVHPAISLGGGDTTGVGWRATLTDANGWYECRAIPATEIHLEASARGHGIGRTQITVVDVRPQPEQAPAIVLMPADLSISGAVVDGDGKPIEGVTVWVQSNDQPTMLKQPKTDAKGRYRIDGVCKGEVLLCAHDARSGRSYSRKVQAGGPDIEINLDDPAYTPQR